jgi:hypothetical protein
MPMALMQLFSSGAAFRVDLDEQVVGLEQRKDTSLGEFIIRAIEEDHVQLTPARALGPTIRRGHAGLPRFFRHRAKVARKID